MLVNGYIRVNICIIENDSFVASELLLFDPYLIIFILSMFFLQAISCCLSSYDEFLSCDRGDGSRGSRALEITHSLQGYCDMDKHSYCHHKGSAYPERAITQFLRENLGLMKRMGSELDPREVKREMRSSSSWLMSNTHVEETIEVEEMEEDRAEKTSSFSLGIMPHGENLFSGISGLNINGQQYLLKQGSGLAMVKNAIDDVLESRIILEEPVEQKEPEVQNTVVTETTKRPASRRSTSESVRTSTSTTTVRVTTSQSSSYQPTTVPTTPSILPSTMTTEMPGTTTDMENIATTWKFPAEEDTTQAAADYQYSGDYELEPVEEVPQPQPHVDVLYYDELAVDEVEPAVQVVFLLHLNRIMLLVSG